MNKNNKWVLIFIKLLIIALFFNLSACKKTDNVKMSNPWELVVNKQVAQPVRQSAFLNENFGLTGGFGNNGRAQYTTDGGQSWSGGESSGGCLFSVDVVNSNVVWISGLSGIQVSRDGGKTFEFNTERNAGTGEKPLTFIDEKTGWFYHEERLKSTKDGGATWEVIPVPKEAQFPRAISLRTENNGYLLDVKGNFFTTTNNGTTWTQNILPLELFKGMRFAIYESVASAIRFSDEKNGFVVIALVNRDAKSKIVGFRTNDGGSSWTPELITIGTGSVYLSPDAQYVTVNDSGKISVYKYIGS